MPSQSMGEYKIFRSRVRSLSPGARGLPPWRRQDLALYVGGLLLAKPQLTRERVKALHLQPFQLSARPEAVATARRY